MVGNLVYSASCLNVKTTICNGRLLYLDGEFQTMDVERVLKDAREASEYLLNP